MMKLRMYHLQLSNQLRFVMQMQTLQNFTFGSCLQTNLDDCWDHFSLSSAETLCCKVVVWGMRGDFILNVSCTAQLQPEPNIIQIILMTAWVLLLLASENEITHTEGSIPGLGIMKISLHTPGWELFTIKCAQPVLHKGTKLFYGCLCGRQLKHFWLTRLNGDNWKDKILIHHLSISAISCIWLSCHAVAVNDQ